MYQEKKIRLALVGHSTDLAKMVRKCSDSQTEDLLTKVVNLDEAVPIAKRLLTEGVEVILGHGGTGNLIFQVIGQPVVNIARSRLDLIIAFMKAKKYDRHIGLTSFVEPTDGMDIIEKLLNIKVYQLIFNTASELEREVQSAYYKGIKVIVGGGISRKIICSLGGNGIVVVPRQSVVQEALREARAIALARRKEAENAARLRTILQMTDEGVIGVDKYGRIDIYNDMAEKILGLDFDKAKGRSLSKIFKNIGLIDVLTSENPEIDTIKKIGENDVLINTLPIKIDGRGKGAVAFLREVERIENISRKLRENLYLKGFVARHSIDDIKGESLNIKQLIDKATKYAITDATIMIQGETGTGKGLIAESIHNLSHRKHEPFVSVNCPALPESLLESELFGYEEGAFTGAKKGGKIGLFELANKGTILLDEIGDIPQSLQVRLLRVIEAKEVMRVGGDRYVPIDVRIISSSNKDLRREVEEGRFRGDLYFRLGILKLNVPPMRNRTEDITSVIEDLLEKYKKNKNNFITSDMVDKMTKYSWPGNIRELRSFIESYLILLGDSANPNLDLFYHLLDEHTGHKADMGRDPINIEKSPCDSSEKSLKEQLGEYEKAIIAETLKDCQFKRKEAAQRLGISVNTLWRKLSSRDLHY